MIDLGTVYSESIGSDANGGFATSAPHDEAGRVQVDEMCCLANWPVDPQLNVRSHGERITAFERYPIAAHVAGYALAPKALNSLFRPAIAQAEMNSEPSVLATVDLAVIHHGEHVSILVQLQ